MKIAALLAVLWLCPVPAWALDACFADSAGDWRGPVFDGGRTKRMESEFHLDAEGELAGSYHVGGDAPYDGVLGGFRQTGPCEAEFEWSDPFGTGVVRIRFNPERGRYDGVWGMTAPFSGYFFNGRRVRGVVVG